MTGDITGINYQSFLTVQGTGWVGPETKGLESNEDRDGKNSCGYFVLKVGRIDEAL
jgi:hypothetical protein